MIKVRKESGKNKKWDVSDKIREEIIKKGYSVEDTEEGSIVRILTH